MAQISTVTVDPWGITFEVRAGETIFDAAYRNGWQWPTNCYAQCRCTVCHVRVVDGTEALGEPSEAELTVLRPLRGTVYRNEADVVVRLACQVRPEADVRVAPRRRLVARTTPTTDRQEPEVSDGQH